MTKTTKTRDLEEITGNFGEIYRSSKEWDGLKKDAQIEFFEAATAELAKQRLPRKTVQYDGPGDEVETWVKTYHPGWKLISCSGERVVLEQDPALMKFVYINRTDNMVYTRSVVEGGPFLDDERLKEEDPDLYEEISEWDPNMVDWTVKSMLYAHDALDDPAPDDELWAVEKSEEFLKARNIPRQIKDPSTWTDTQSAAVQKYMIPGQISVKLTPPREAKKEDIES